MPRGFEDNLNVANDDSRPFEERFEAAMSAYYDSQQSGRYREVMIAMLGLVGSAEDSETRGELEIAIATLEETMALVEDAIDRFTRARERDGLTRPQLGRIAYYLASIHLRGGRVDAAANETEELARHLDAMPADAHQKYQYMLGLIAEQRNEPEAGFRAFRRVISLSPEGTQERHAAELGMMRLQMLSGDFELARMTAESSTPTGDYDRLYNQSVLLNALLALGHLREASSLAARVAREAGAIGFPVIEASGVFMTGVCRAAQADFDGAVAAFERSISIDHSPPLVDRSRVWRAWVRGEALPEVEDQVARQSRGALLDGPSTSNSSVEQAWVSAYLGQFFSGAALTPDGTLFRTPSGDYVDLTRREPARRILARLASASRADEEVSTGELFSVGWPDVDSPGKNGLRRVYSELHRLREMGLTIEAEQDGYRCRPRIGVLVIDDAGEPRYS